MNKKIKQSKKVVTNFSLRPKKQQLNVIKKIDLSKLNTKRIKSVKKVKEVAKLLISNLEEERYKMEDELRQVDIAHEKRIRYERAKRKSKKSRNDFKNCPMKGMFTGLKNYEK
tara:strand:- start:1082 stop:1420 length:339 start_codon:yes stop_codon:yes gene_type:complete